APGVPRGVVDGERVVASELRELLRVDAGATARNQDASQLEEHGRRTRAGALELRDGVFTRAHALELLLDLVVIGDRLLRLVDLGLELTVLLRLLAELLLLEAVEHEQERDLRQEQAE